jgi:thioesterase domain-containing protein
MVALRSTGTAPPVFLVAPTNADVLDFTTLARALGDDHPVYGLQLHCQAAQGWPVGSVTTMAARCVSEIRSVHLAGACCIAGAGNGFVVAAEVARQLLAQGVDARLVLLDTDPSNEAIRQLPWPLRDLPWLAEMPTWWRRLKSLCRRLVAQAGRPVPRETAAEAAPSAGSGCNERNTQVLLEIGRAIHRHRPGPLAIRCLHVQSAGSAQVPVAKEQRRAGPVIVSGTEYAKVAASDHGTWFDSPHVHEVATLLTDFSRRAPPGAAAHEGAPSVSAVVGIAA